MLISVAFDGEKQERRKRNLTRWKKDIEQLEQKAKQYVKRDRDPSIV